MSPSSTGGSSARESYLNDDLLAEDGAPACPQLMFGYATNTSGVGPLDRDGLDLLQQQYRRSESGGPRPPPQPNHLNGLPTRSQDSTYQDEVEDQSIDQHDAPMGAVRLVIGIDYGTTFTGVAYATSRSDVANLEDIRTISTWGTNMTNHFKIPSIISYSPTHDGHKQWGASIDPSAVTMVNTKLELDVQDNKIEELELLLQVLDGTCNLKFEHVRSSNGGLDGGPEYSWKDPEQIVTDYLTEVFRVVWQTFKDSGTHVMGHIPVDIVITVPVHWSYRAKNSTLQAIRKAGFNDANFTNLQDIIMVTEPEAAAIFTARHLKEETKEEFLEVDDCFVLCDAGGGTVDAVSYRVKQLEPTLELERFSSATSAKVGSSFIDTEFKRWLRGAIGDDIYGALDPNMGGEHVTNSMEGALVRQLIKSFDEYKKTFSNKSQDATFELPPVILPKPKPKSLNVRGKVEAQPSPKPEPIHVPDKVNKGFLTITNKEMKSLFDPYVNGVIKLVLSQVYQVSRKGYRVKNVFLVGGFGESPYLQEELKISLGKRNILMRRPNQRKAWTAVVQGAVLYGIEKAHYKDVVTMAMCTTSYGIKINKTMRVFKYDPADVIRDPVTDKVMAQDQMIWLIRRGDLLLSDAHKETEERIVYRFTDTSKRRFQLPIYEYPKDDQMEPGRYHDAQHELKTIKVLDLDLSKVPLNNFDQGENPLTGASYFEATLALKMKLTERKLTVEILMDEDIICEAAIEDLESET